MKYFLHTILLLLSMNFVACSTLSIEKKEFKPDAYPVHFVGLIPAANTTVEYQLDLISEDIYFLRTRYVKDDNTETTIDDIGKWYIDNQNRMILKGTKKTPRYFDILNTKSIEVMNTKGQKTESTLNYKLQISHTAKTIQPRLHLKGMYSYMADSASFTECITKMKFPVAFEEDNRALENAYLKMQTQAGQKIKAHLDVHILYRDTMEGDTRIRTLVVKKFIQLIPKEVCQCIHSHTVLSNTYWKLTMLGEKAVKPSKRREAHIIFKDSKIHGSSGCNKFSGVYILDNDKLSLGNKSVAMTRMFCQNSIENEFISALKKMYRYEINDEYLEIFDNKGIKLARFESVYLY